MARDTVSHDIVEIYPMGKLPKTAAAKAAYNASWRRNTAAEQAAKPAASATKAKAKARGAK
jgi:sarcosine oxidase subunit delta